MSNRCYHCDEVVPQGFHAEISISGEQQQFCCYGCLAIAETIVSGGLENFYKHRTQASEKPDTFSRAQQDELYLYDDPALQVDFVDNVNQQSEASLSISGIACAACIWLLEREILKIDGVTTFSINHTTHKANLVWLNKQCKLSSVLIKIRHLGYKAFPYQEDNARKLARSEKHSAVFRIAVAGIAAMQNMMFSIPLYLGIYSGIDDEFVSFFRWVSLLMCTPVVFFSAQPFLKAALRDIKTRHLTMDIPVSLAILAAYISSAAITIMDGQNLETDVYFDSVSMFTFFLLLGRFIEMQTRHKHLNSDIEMGSLLPSTAILKTPKGETSKPAHQLKIGDTLIIKQGQVSPADGIVIEGESRVDESALTGEFLPIEKSVGSQISGGTANIENTLFVKVTATPKHSRVSAIIKLLDKAQSEKPNTVRVADQVASYFVAGVLLSATLVGLYWYLHTPESALSIVLAVLVVTCPCALALATPTAMTNTNTALRAKGFLITKSHTLEAMNQITDIIFDKTGTLTKGALTIDQVKVFSDIDEPGSLEIAAALEHHSSHPIAQAFAQYFVRQASQVNSHLGLGLDGFYSFDEDCPSEYYRLGSLNFLTLPAEQKNKCISHPGLSLFLANRHELVAQFMLNDTLRDDSETCIRTFQENGVNIHVLSGDQQHAVERVARDLGIEQFQAEQSPEQKLAYVNHLQSEGKQIAMVGDGINDLPVLSGAKLSIAMGEASDITKLNSDAVLLNGHMSVLNEAFQYAQQTRKIIKQNITWAILYNLSMLPMAAAGWVPPYFAALGMSLSSLFVVFNSLRLKHSIPGK
jgi:Cu2+-exporting ATPase